MDFDKIAQSLLPLLGGKENIASAAHCATRLRLVLLTTHLPINMPLARLME